LYGENYDAGDRICRVSEQSKLHNGGRYDTVHREPALYPAPRKSSLRVHRGILQTVEARRGDIDTDLLPEALPGPRLLVADDYISR